MVNNYLKCFISFCIFKMIHQFLMVKFIIKIDIKLSIFVPKWLKQNVLNKINICKPLFNVLFESIRFGATTFFVQQNCTDKWTNILLRNQNWMLVQLKQFEELKTNTNSETIFFICLKSYINKTLSSEN